MVRTQTWFFVLVMVMAINCAVLFRFLPFHKPTVNKISFPTTATTATRTLKSTTSITTSARDEKVMATTATAAATVEFQKPRNVVKKVLAREQKEGDGANVRRSIGTPQLRNLDPFLMLDEFRVSPPAGFPDHPHRGFETVTYMFEGATTHQDFAGHKGTIRVGDVQWMTAGRGIVHSEMPEGKEPNRGLQLWVNLSSKDKMCEPNYQELQSANISMAEKDGVKVRVIAGESLGVKSPVYTRTPTMYLHFTMQPGTQLNQPVPENWNSFIYILEGDGVFGGESATSSSATAAPAHNCLVFNKGDGVNVWNKSDKPLDFVLFAGEPIGEPVVQYGPFVMNTQEEIQKTFMDYYSYRNGFENARYWKSS